MAASGNLGSMASAPQVDPGQQGADPQSGSAPAPSQGEANPTQLKLAQLFQACKMLAQENPVLSAGLQKAAQGVHEAQSALLTQPQQQPASSNPPY